MIYVLTGIAKSGKTKVAREIVKRKSIPLFSTDYIMMMLSKGNKDLDIDIDASDSSVAKDLEPYIYGMISTMIENKVDYLLEGVHFNPDFSRRLIEKYPNDIRIVYLGYKDKNFKDKAKELLLYKNEIENPWFLSFKGEKLFELMEYMVNESQRVYELCIQFDLEYIEVRNIVDQMDEIMKTLFDKKLRF
jgi:2-phosphoglycerate kinase